MAWTLSGQRPCHWGNARSSPIYRLIGDRYSTLGKRCTFDGRKAPIVTAQARYDKSGNQLPDTGRGCGCALCADSGAPRYERRQDATRSRAAWSEARRDLFRAIRGLIAPRRSEMA